MTAKDYYREGLKGIASGDLEAAARSFLRALEHDGAFYLAHLGLSQTLDRQGDVEGAVEQARRAAALAPEEPLVHTSLSRLYQQKGMIAEAEEEMATSQRLQQD